MYGHEKVHQGTAEAVCVLNLVRDRFPLLEVDVDKKRRQEGTGDVEEHHKLEGPRPRDDDGAYFKGVEHGKQLHQREYKGGRKFDVMKHLARRGSFICHHEDARDGDGNVDHASEGKEQVDRRELMQVRDPYREQHIFRPLQMEGAMRACNR